LSAGKGDPLPGQPPMQPPAQFPSSRLPRTFQSASHPVSCRPVFPGDSGFSWLRDFFTLDSFLSPATSCPGMHPFLLSPCNLMASHITEMSILLITAKQGPIDLFCIPNINRTKIIGPSISYWFQLCQAPLLAAPASGGPYSSVYPQPGRPPTPDASPAAAPPLAREPAWSPWRASRGGSVHRACGRDPPGSAAHSGSVRPARRPPVPPTGLPSPRRPLSTCPSRNLGCI
jgi:hypothetical protein